jgi:hypothetical protein
MLVELELNERSQWKDVKNNIKDDQRYKLIKGSKNKKKLFDDFIMTNILKTPGQKRQRLLD